MNRIITVIAFFAAFMFFSAETIWAQSSIPNLTGKWVSTSYAHHHEKTDFLSSRPTSHRRIMPLSMDFQRRLAARGYYVPSIDNQRSSC